MTAFTIARMPERIASGSSGQAATTALASRKSDLPRVSIEYHDSVFVATGGAPAPSRVTRWERVRGNLIDVVAPGRSAAHDLGHRIEAFGIGQYLAVTIDYISTGVATAIGREVTCRIADSRFCNVTGLARWTAKPASRL
jgi:hypothetical protein